MASQQRATDVMTRTIDQLLNTEYGAQHKGARIEVYRYNPGAIRVRIIDPDFKGKPIDQRENEAWNILEPLPDDIYQQITMLLLLTPEEAKTSLVNVEFEDPSPSLL